MRLYEDDTEEVRPSFSFGDESNSSQKQVIDEEYGRHYDDDVRSGTFDPVVRVQTKLNLISIIIPCLVAIAILFVYFQIKGELASIQNTGTNEIKNLSLELQTKVTNIETRLSALEQKINSDLEASNKSIKEIDSKITGIAQSKADKKDFEALNSQADAKLAQIQKSASETATAAADKIKKDVEASVGQMQKNVDSAVKSVSDMEKNLTPEIETLKGSVSEASGIAKSAQKEAAALKSAGFATKDDISRETNGLEAKIRELEQKIAKLPKSGSATSLAPAAPKSTKNSSQTGKAQPAKEKAVKNDYPEHQTETTDTFDEPVPYTDEEEPVKSEPAKQPSKPSKTKGGFSEQNL